MRTQALLLNLGGTLRFQSLVKSIWFAQHEKRAVARSGVCMAGPWGTPTTFFGLVQIRTILYQLKRDHHHPNVMAGFMSASSPASQGVARLRRRLCRGPSRQRAGSGNPRVSTPLRDAQQGLIQGFRASWRLSLMLVSDMGRVAADPGQQLDSESKCTLVSWSWKVERRRRPSKDGEWYLVLRVVLTQRQRAVQISFCHCNN